MRRTLLVAGLWLAAVVAPDLALAQGGPALSGWAELAVQPWRLIDWTKSTDGESLGWTPRLFGDLALEDPPPAGMTWQSSFAERVVGAHDSRNLTNWQARAASPLWSGTVAGDFNLLALDAAYADGLAGEARRWVRFALKESWDGLALGVRVESVSPGLEKVIDRKLKGETEGGEIWLEGRQGPARWRLSGGRFWDNLADYPWQPRTTKTQAGAAVGLALPLNSVLSLEYQNGLAEREPGRRPRTTLAAMPQVSESQSILTSLTSGGSAWTFTVSSTYSPASDLRNQDRDTTSVVHDASASLQVLPSIWITPAVTVAEDTYEWSGIRSHTTSASVSVSWISVLEGVDLSVWGSYTRGMTTDDLYDATTINTAADLIWRLRQVGPTRTSLVFSVGSNHYLDGVTASTGYAEIYGMLTLRIVAF